MEFDSLHFIVHFVLIPLKRNGIINSWHKHHSKMILWLQEILKKVLVLFPAYGNEHYVGVGIESVLLLTCIFNVSIFFEVLISIMYLIPYHI